MPSQDVVVGVASHYAVENVFFSDKIMEQRRWTSAEVVGSPSHLPRTGLILAHYGLQWRTQA